MVVAGGDYVHFVVEYGGKIEKCRVTETALLKLCTAHRYLCKAPSRIEHLALAKLQREGQSDRGVVVTTEDLNP
jgi:hypothetical protein